MIKVKDVAFVGYPVSDVPRARKFYENILGLKPTMDHCFEGGMWWIEYDIGSSTLAITNAWEPSGKSAPQIALEVEDIEAAMQFVNESKIPVILEIQQSPVCRFACISDPDGNGIILHQHKH